MLPRVFLVTGASGGIGRHLVGALAARGDRVFATDVDGAAPGEPGWPADRVLARALDVRDPAAWARAVAEAESAFGRVDVLLNVAGYLRPGWLLDLPLDEVDRHFDVNAKGVALGMLSVAPGMLRRGEGHVVNIASMAALAPIPGLALYSASKFAVRALSIAADREWRPRGVAVSVVCPDAVQTSMLEKQRGSEAAALTFSGRRILTVEDVGRAILDDVLRRRPLELHLPVSRGLLARAANLMPGLAGAVEPLLRRVGRARQRRGAAA